MAGGFVTKLIVFVHCIWVIFEGLYFWIFQRCLLLQKLIPGPIQKYITTINNIMLACTHVIR